MHAMLLQLLRMDEGIIALMQCGTVAMVARVARVARVCSQGSGQIGGYSQSVMGRLQGC